MIGARRRPRLLPFLLAFSGICWAESVSGADEIHLPACRNRTLLLADRILSDEVRGHMVAQGNVRVERMGHVLTSEEVIYDRGARQFLVPGSFSLVFPDGEVLSGSRGVVDEHIANGEIELARVESPKEPGTFKAVRAVRSPGQSLVLEQAWYSPCPVSDANPVPLWRIRATRVVHDESAQDVVYANPVFEFAGVPIGYLPVFRHPDPSVKRRSGYLPPSFHAGSLLGFGIRIPYYIALAPDREAKVSVLAKNREGPLLDGEYRQLFSSGELEVSGSVTRSRLSERVSQLRGHVFLDSEIRASGGTAVGADLNLSSHPGYLNHFDYSSEDRLRNRFYVERFSEESQFELTMIAFQTQRLKERGRTLPYVLPEIAYSRTLQEFPLGGTLQLGGDVRLLRRIEGRRVSSAGVEIEWEHERLLSGGFLVGVHGRVRMDGYTFGGESLTPSGIMHSNVVRVLPQAGVEATWPLARVNRVGAHMLEPFAQLILAPERRSDAIVPNEDSLDVEFDEFSLLARNRFTGRDRIETGNRGAVGMRYTFLGRSGIRFEGIGGQVYRASELTDFTPASGLRGKSSDYVFAWSVSFDRPTKFHLLHRSRLDRDYAFKRNDITIQAEWETVSLDGTYVFLEGDPDAPPSAPERLDGGEIRNRLGAQISDFWHASIEARHDMVSNRSISASGSFRYTTDCLWAQLDVVHKYNFSVVAPADTKITLSINLPAF